MSDAPDVLIVTQDPELENLAAALCAESIIADRVGSYVDASRVLDSSSRCVCVIDGDLPQELAVQVAELAFRSQQRRTMILADPDSCERFGNRRAYPDEVDICPRNQTVEESVLRLKAIMILAGHDVRITSADSADGITHPSEAPNRLGKVVAVFSVKGGVGKTTLAVNLAVGLAQIYGHKPLLVDANLYFGDAPLLLGVAPKKSIFDLCDLTTADATTLQELVTEHESGISVLGSPPDLTTIEALNSERLGGAISAYRRLFDHVIVDTRPSLDEATLQILDAADRIVLVTTPEVGAVHQTARFLSLAETLGYKRKLMIVLNRADSGLDTPTVEERLGMRVSASVVSAGRPVVAAGNRGVPIVLDDPDRKEAVTRDLARIVQLVSSTTTQPHVEAKDKAFLGLPAKRLPTGAAA